MTHSQIVPFVQSGSYWIGGSFGGSEQQIQDSMCEGLVAGCARENSLAGVDM